MKRILLLILFILCGLSYSFSQNTSSEHLDSLVNSFVQKLKAEDIDTICVYQDYFISGFGGRRDTANGRCNYDDDYIPTYIIWVKNSETYFTEKDNCFDYSTNKIYPYNLWSAFFIFKDTIKNEEVKPFQSEDKAHGWISTSTVDHSGHRNFKFYLRNDIVEKEFNSHNMELISGYGAEKNININYEHNISLKSKYFLDLIRRLVKEQEDFKPLSKRRR